jgi:hypothetical protein
MRRITPRVLSYVGSVLLSVGSCACGDSGGVTAPAKVVCDRFKILHQVSGSVLKLSLDTDLPDFTQVMVSVSRSYLKTGSTDEYPVNYFEEKGTVGTWRTPREIRLDNAAWRASLRERQQVAARAGIAFDVQNIETNIEVSATVPVHQLHPVFGVGNRNLEGKAVSKSGSWNLVNAAARLVFPLGQTESRASTWASWDSLSVGQTYRLSRKTPLMPELNPVDPLAAIANAKGIDVGGIITVRAVATKDSTRWYRVEALSAGGQRVGSGWVNSTALLGQDIAVVATK